MPVVPGVPVPPVPPVSAAVRFGPVASVVLVPPAAAVSAVAVRFGPVSSVAGRLVPPVPAPLAEDRDGVAFAVVRNISAVAALDFLASEA